MCTCHHVAVKSQLKVIGQLPLACDWSVWVTYSISLFKVWYNRSIYCVFVTLLQKVAKQRSCVCSEHVCCCLWAVGIMTDVNWSWLSLSWFTAAPCTLCKCSLWRFGMYWICPCSLSLTSTNKTLPRPGLRSMKSIVPYTHLVFLPFLMYFSSPSFLFPSRLLCFPNYPCPLHRKSIHLPPLPPQGSRGGLSSSVASCSTPAPPPPPLAPPRTPLP